MQQLFYSLNSFDYILGGIFLFFAFTGFIIGLTNKVLSFLSWIVAIMTTLYFHETLFQWIENFIALSFWSKIITVILFFIVLLAFLLSLVGSIVDVIKKSKISIIDRILGAALGLGIASIVACITCHTLDFFYPRQERPMWLKNSHFYPEIMERSHNWGDLFFHYVPDHIQKYISPKETSYRLGLKDSVETPYESQSREQLDSLINTIE